MCFLLFLSYIFIALVIVMLVKTDMKKNRVSHIFYWVMCYILYSSRQAQFSMHDFDLPLN